MGKTGKVPSGTAERSFRPLRDFVFHRPQFPALKRWAIFTAFPFGMLCVKQPDKQAKKAPLFPARIRTPLKIGQKRAK